MKLRILFEATKTLLGCSNYPWCSYKTHPDKAEEGSACPSCALRGDKSKKGPGKLVKRGFSYKKPGEAKVGPDDAGVAHTCGPRADGETHKDVAIRNKACEGCAAQKQAEEDYWERSIAAAPSKDLPGDVQDRGTGIQLDPNQSKVMQILDVHKQMGGEKWSRRGKNRYGKRIRKKAICQEPGCDNKVKHKYGAPKKWCPEHLQNSPYVADLMQQLAGDPATGAPESAAAMRRVWLAALSKGVKVRKRRGSDVLPDPRNPSKSTKGWVYGVVAEIDTKGECDSCDGMGDIENTDGTLRDCRVCKGSGKNDSGKTHRVIWDKPLPNEVRDGKNIGAWENPDEFDHEYWEDYPSELEPWYD